MLSAAVCQITYTACRTRHGDGLRRGGYIQRVVAHGIRPQCKHSYVFLNSCEWQFIKKSP